MNRLRLKSRIAFWPSLLLLASAALLGCRGASEGPELVPAGGTVLWKGKSLPDADVMFYPIEGTKGGGGTARTDVEGKFKLKYVRGGDGVPAGAYKVTVSRRVINGKPVPVGDDTPPADSPAKEELPEVFSSYDSSKIRATVTAGEPIVLHLK